MTELLNFATNLQPKREPGCQSPEQKCEEETAEEERHHGVRPLPVSGDSDVLSRRGVHAARGLQEGRGTGLLVSSGGCHTLQPADIGLPTGNGKKLSCSQAQLGQAQLGQAQLGQAQLGQATCLAVA